MLARALLRCAPRLNVASRATTLIPSTSTHIFNAPTRRWMSSHPNKNESGRLFDEDVMDEAEFEKREKAKANLKASEDKVRASRMKKGLLVVTALGLVTVAVMGAPSEDDKAPENEGFFAGYWRRLTKSAGDAYETASAPLYEKLLPDPLPPPYGYPLTLVIELNDSLTRLEWEKSVGWRVATRPGVMQFLAYLSKYYELVIFANSPGFNTEGIVNALDPYRVAPYRLFREATRTVDKKTVKDLSILNRNLANVVCVDVNPDAYSLQPENGVYLPRWEGDKDDRELIKMMTFLEEMALFMQYCNMTDVRPILSLLRSIHPDDLPQAWQDYKTRTRNEHNQESVDAPKSFLSRLVGGRKQQSMSTFDVIEHAAKAEREAFAESFPGMIKAAQKQLEEEQRKQLEMFKSQKVKMIDVITGNVPQPDGSMNTKQEMN